MLDEILAIPGNRVVFDLLQQRLAEHRAIAFVGAGASSGMYPLWGQFIDLLGDYAVEQGRAAPGDLDRWRNDRSSTPQQRVNHIVRKLGDPLYHEFMRLTFGPRRGLDGHRYTATHAALLRLPFRGFVTTNYDPALEFARMDFRPDCLTTGTPTWQDEDEVHRWYTGDVFRAPDACPILWLHGYHARPAGIVLNASEYAGAYAAGLYRRTFERLWGQDHLVFVGFGFNDPQFTFMVGEMLHETRGVRQLPRHIAILGLPPEASDDSSGDLGALAERRVGMEEAYHVRALFYRVKRLPDGGEDHSELFTLLDGLATGCARGMPIPHAAPARAAPVPFPSRWVHETTNDDKFIGREEERARLDRWVRDEAVRAIGVTAVGGTGKTSLVGHWLKETHGWKSRPFKGLFAWSFYQERNSELFLHALLDWAHETLAAPGPGDRADLVHAALALMRDHALVVVLDGLEVLQSGLEHARYGAFLDGAMREFLSGLCAREHPSLAVLTSRFAFADLERQLGTAFHQLELPGLAPEQGAALLAGMDVLGTEVDRRHVSRSLEGHPLGLRVFADAISESLRDRPLTFLEEAFRTGDLPVDAPLAGKVKRMLVFYERRLPPLQAHLLGVVALFRTPVAESAILRLMRGLLAEPEPLPDDGVLAAQLGRLHIRGILTREPVDDGYGYACHPILRDHFRTALLGTGARSARKTADLLTGRPSSEAPRSPADIEPTLLAIEILLHAGEFKAADALYRTRLEDGRVFKWIPAVLDGLECARSFVRNERRKECEKTLQRSGVRFYLNSAGVFATLSGHFELAARCYADANAINRELQAADLLCIGLLNEAYLSVALGRLVEAEALADEAHSHALRVGSDDRMLNVCVLRAEVAMRTGRVQASAEHFARANTLARRKTNPHGEDLYGASGAAWAQLLLQSGHVARAVRHTEQNLRTCERLQRNNGIAICRRVLAACALAQGRVEDAGRELDRAEFLVHRGQSLLDLAELYITGGQVALARHDPIEAQNRASEALAVARSRGMPLVHADALVLQGRVRLLQAEVIRDAAGGEAVGATWSDMESRALDDAEYAGRIARECGYPWAEHGAAALQADAYTALAASSGQAVRHRQAAQQAREAAKILSSRLTNSQQDLADAEAKAVAWLRAWEKQKRTGRRSRE